MHKVYEKIEAVLKVAGRPLAPHEFEQVFMTHDTSLTASQVKDGRAYVGCSEASLARRLREMVHFDSPDSPKVQHQRRNGKPFVEYWLS